MILMDLGPTPLITPVVILVVIFFLLRRSSDFGGPFSKCSLIGS